MLANTKTDAGFNDRDIRAFLEHGCELEGTLTFTGVVRLNGRFRGDIQSDDTLIVGETAEVEGKVNIGAIIVGGRVMGDIISKHRVEILSTGTVEGTITAPSLVTHEGAQLIGQINVVNIKSAKPAGKKN